MKFIFMRHGSTFKKSLTETSSEDFERQLSKEGIVEVKEMVQSTYFLFRDVKAIFTSPLARSIQTAQIIYAHHPDKHLEILASLDKESPLEDFQLDLKNLKPNKSFCFVGHEPHITQSLSLLLYRKNTSKILLPKASIIVLEGNTLKDLRISHLLSPKLINRF